MLGLMWWRSVASVKQSLSSLVSQSLLLTACKCQSFAVRWKHWTRDNLDENDDKNDDDTDIMYDTGDMIRQIILTVMINLCVWYEGQLIIHSWFFSRTVWWTPRWRRRMRRWWASRRRSWRTAQRAWRLSCTPRRWTIDLTKPNLTS